MRELTDSERLEIAMSLLSDNDIEIYAAECAKLEQGKATDPAAYGFHDVPAECEDLECKDCPLSMAERKVRECPYLDD